MEELDNEEIEDEILESIDAFKDYLGIKCTNTPFFAPHGHC